MTCKDCVNYAICANAAISDPYHAHKMWMIDFWEDTARCTEYEETEDAE